MLIVTVDCCHVFNPYVDLQIYSRPLNYSNVDQCPLPVIVSGVSAIPLTLTTARRAVRSESDKTAVGSRMRQKIEL